MRDGWFLRTRSLIFAVLLHVIAVVLLLVSFEFTSETVPLPSGNDVNIVDAVSVDKKEVEKELALLKKIEAEKKAAEQRRLKELEEKEKAAERKARELEKKRQEEEKRLAEARKQKELEQKKREEEQKRLAELEKQRQLEEEKKRLIEEQKRKEAEELARIEAERKKAEEERIRKEAEEEERRRKEELQRELEAEERKRQAEEDAALQSSYINAIYRSIVNEFNRTGLPDGLSCVIRVILAPGGKVVGFSVIKSSGNTIFDRRAETAVRKAEPLPAPDDSATLDRLDLRDNTFTFEP
jgi:colicin import membrane protein